jgi:glutathione-regulated potassium-efflux system ancillary protein KefG
MADKKVLLLFAHPALEKSKLNLQLLKVALTVDGVTVHDLYERYPDFQIDIPREQKLLLEHDVVIFQHPFYWYSAPALVKEWLDLVLEHGWAYGSKGEALSGKWFLNAITTGGPEQAYQKDGFNRHTVRQFLAPFDQTAYLCKMKYLAPFVVHLSMFSEELGTQNKSMESYRTLLEKLVRGEINLERAQAAEKINELL